MTFYHELPKLQDIDFPKAFSQFGPDDVKRALAKPEPSPEDFLSFLSPAAVELIEDMAQLAHRLTLKHFGHTVLLFTPLYLSNYCENQCVYCGFNTTHQIVRRKLTLAEVEDEARAISQTGLKHILILTGESRQHSPVSYIRDCVTILRKYFSSISIEVYALTEDEYTELIQAGLDGLTIYQEVYDQDIYPRLHPKGPKRDYRFRLEAPERAARAGVRTVSIGSLLGLGDWRTEAFICGMHAHYLQKAFPDVELAVSFPRMRPHYGGYQPEFPVSDHDLVQIILAFRLFLPRVGITISTRECPELRENLLKLGVTKISAGSSTVVGGHTDSQGGTGQFDISDERSVEEMRRAITALGCKPIFKDWHQLDRVAPGGK